MSAAASQTAAYESVAVRTASPINGPIASPR